MGLLSHMETMGSGGGYIGCRGSMNFEEMESGGESDESRKPGQGSPSSTNMGLGSLCDTHNASLNSNPNSELTHWAQTSSFDLHLVELPTNLNSM